MAQSSIAGCIRLNGDEEGLADVNSMLRRSRGQPGRDQSWCGGPAALGARCPEGQQSSSAGSGPLLRNRYAVVASARIDNKAELQQRFRTGGFSSDAECILHAYVRAGERCVDLLTGDFAFAIWDTSQRKLFCARDRFGVEPLYYFCTSGRFAFASELGQLSRGNSSQIDEAMLGEYLLGLVTDVESTLYRNIRRLPPAHCMTVSADGVAIRRYWQLEAGEPPRDRDLPGRFREIFERAVAARLEGVDAPGVLLSGGLDSSSIACTAGSLRNRNCDPPLPAFSLLFEDGVIPTERPYVEAVLRQGGLDPVYVRGDGHAPFGEFETVLAEQEGPFLAPNLSSLRRVIRTARDRGVSVLLDGHGGDEVVSHGFGLLDDLARSRNWVRLWHELGAAAATFNDSRFSHFVQLARRHHPRNPAVRLLGLLQRNLHRPESGSVRPGSLVDRDLVDRTDLRERIRSYFDRISGAPANEQQQHLQMLNNPVQAYAFETLHRLNRAAGVVGRYPFWDQRLIEFCVSLPAREKLSGGWSRLILRRAMNGILPAKVAWRRDKLNFAPSILFGMLHCHRDLIEDVIDTSGPLAGYVDRQSASDLYRHLAANPQDTDGASVQALWRIVALGLWLRQRELSPATAPKTLEQAA